MLTVICALFFLISGAYECSEYITVSLNYWNDTTQSAVAYVYSGDNEWGILVGTFQETSASGSTLLITNTSWELFIRYNVLTKPESTSAYSIAVDMQTSCETGYVGVDSSVKFFVWFLPLLCALICVTCVILIITYNKNKNKVLHSYCFLTFSNLNKVPSIKILLFLCKMFQYNLKKPNLPQCHQLLSQYLKETLTLTLLIHLITCTNHTTLCM